MKTTFFLCLCLCLSWFAKAGKRQVGNPGIPAGAYALVQLIDTSGVLKASAVYGEIMFEKSGKQVHIYLGCNRISGRLNVSQHNQCKPAITMSTRMACPNAIEDLFKNAFQSSNHFKIQHDSLLLFNGNSMTMIMVKKTRKTNPVRKEDPQGAYKLYSLLDGKKMIKGNYSKTRMSIDGKQFRANVGCNSMFGEWKTEGQRINPLKLGMTDMYCEDVDRLERLFTDNLAKTNRWRWNNGRLEFMKDQQVLLIFSPSKN